MSQRVDEVVSKAAGKPKATPAKSDGLVGVFRTLADQHAEIAALFARAQTTADQRAELWPAIRRTLIAHEHSEVRELYPVLRQYEATCALADDHDAEARELDAVITRLDGMNLRSDTWCALFDELVATVLEHATEKEEGEIFPAAQRVIGEPRAIDLDAVLLAAHQQIRDIA